MKISKPYAQLLTYFGQVPYTRMHIHGELPFNTTVKTCVLESLCKEVCLAYEDNCIIITLGFIQTDNE